MEEYILILKLGQYIIMGLLIVLVITYYILANKQPSRNIHTHEDKNISNDEFENKEGISFFQEENDDPIKKL